MLNKLRKQGEKRPFGELFCPALPWVQMHFIFSDNGHILYLFCNVKNKKNLQYFLKRAEKSVILIVFDDDLSEVHTYTVAVSYHQSTWKTISWSVTVYNKSISSQYNLTAQIEPIQDKQNYSSVLLEKCYIKYII